MKATIDNVPVIIKLELTNAELEDILNGLGNTSIEGRMQIGMTAAQASIMSKLYFALDVALDEVKE